ncbi:MAG: MATE family efflux transporter [Dysgonomonas sp.]|jgi:putative MATE family efflux protein|uniref:MATE family efflux transporter n=1 Tax=unclassified Dysgonomonas TaxID=2630389 RepID=UPI0025C65016|nr:MULTISPECIES: MATE family efflux transporter [unclassified Dysgonomonas]MDR1714604.1 MATE family efflux transporter [Prevotella sp.]MDR2003893.1 MATE family efflux transporter [Prevotella sp.]HMM03793.1 MATE family efflux transporter [Dysgonomonas sp.]
MKSGIQNLTEGNIFSTLIRLALPLMGTSFLQMAYTLMAMSWVGRLGTVSHPEIATKSEAAIGAIGMLLWLTSSVAYLAMIGSEVAVGQSIGAKKMKRAAIYASHSTTTSIMLGVTWIAILFIFANQILSFFKLEADITEDAVLYLRILTVSLPFQFLSYNFTGIYNGAGRSIVPFRNNAAGLVLNMILDPILMFVMGLGLHGAAIGTVAAQLFVFSLFFYQIKFGSRILGNFSFFIRPKAIYLKRIFFLGTPVSVMNSLYAIINMNLARVASIHGGHLGLMTQTTGGQIEAVTWNTSQGFSTALSAFVAQNYAANKLERGKKAYYYTIRVMLTLGIVVSICFILFGAQIFGIIVPEENAMQAGAQYLFVMGLVQIFMMFELTTQGMFNGIGRTIEPAIISIVFNALRIPLAYYLAAQMGITGVWWAIAISTICKGIILPTWFAVVYRKIKKKKPKIG